MFKKLFTILVMTYWFCFTQTIAAMTIEELSALDFFDLGTIQTWVNSQFHKDRETMGLIQSVIYNTSSAESDFFCIHKPVLATENEEYPSLTTIELAFLQMVHEISLYKIPITLEIGAGSGRVSGKVPLAFERGEGMHFMNDINSKLSFNEEYLALYRTLGWLSEPRIIQNPILAHDPLTEGFDSFVSKNLKKLTITGFNLPLLKMAGTVDLIYVQNLEHLFSPEQHHIFLETIADLLNPGGYAYLSAVGPDFFDKDRESITFFEASRKKFFSPEAYQTAIDHHPRLKLVQAFYLDRNGKLQTEPSVFSAAIAQKVASRESHVVLSSQPAGQPVGVAISNGKTLLDLAFLVPDMVSHPNRWR